jgi:hypothetical protein
MDNTTILFNAIQRTYRSAIVGLIRGKLTDLYGPAGVGQLQNLFGKKDPETGKTYWETIKKAATERRSGGTGELSTPIRDDYELVGVEHFFNIFESHFDSLCSGHTHKPKKEKNQAKQALITWMKQIKNIRDPISHPTTDDIGYDDSANVLYCARKILDFCGLAEASAQILRLQRTLLGGLATAEEKTLTDLPPADEVVMDFVGRHRELALLSDWLAGGTSRRWALSGDGGKGKSAIAYAFGRSVASRDDHGLEGVFWMSAKRRRFLEGSTVLVDRPDFHDKASAIRTVLAFFGESGDDPSGEVALSLLSDFPSLLIVDDIDTVEGDGEDAIQFLVMTIPERTQSKVLITSRRAVFGMASVTTQVLGLSPQDAEEFLKSRCDLMGVPPGPVLAVKEKLLDVTDSSPLFLEDLLRLSQSGFSIDKAVGLWAGKRGTEARKYAIQREYDQLDDDGKQVLLALTVHGPCGTEVLCRGLDWREDRLLTAMQQLRKMFLMPSQKVSGSAQVLALNQNTQLLVKDVFSETEAYRRTERMIKAATGALKTKRSEDQRVDAILRSARFLAHQWRADEAEAEVQAATDQFPGRPDLYATLAWIQKKRKDFASARMNFRRAHELGCNNPDAYWHWSEMEAANKEWNASAQAAELGVQKFKQDQGLLFRLGYAFHRQGRELILEGDLDQGAKCCRQAQELLERALHRHDAEVRNYSLLNQIYRAMALNLEALDDSALLPSLFARWKKECPGDAFRETEYQRLRQKYPLDSVTP